MTRKTVSFHVSSATANANSTNTSFSIDLVPELAVVVLLAVVDDAVCCCCLLLLAARYMYSCSSSHSRHSHQSADPNAASLWMLLAAGALDECSRRLQSTLPILLLLMIHDLSYY
jgi:hypothetical protein